MSGVIENLLVAILAAMLIVAVIGDLRARIIPNRLTGAVALLAIPFWLFAELAFWPDVALRLGVALAVLITFALPFRFGWMGGGDVKLLAALALWLTAIATVKLLVIMSIAGGVLTLATAARHRLRRCQGAVEVPYGVAIAGAGLWLIGERFFYQFG